MINKTIPGQADTSQKEGKNMKGYIATIWEYSSLHQDNKLFACMRAWMCVSVYMRLNVLLKVLSDKSSFVVINNW